MEDYKELIERLNRHIIGDDYFNINSDFASAVVQAADAIEHLVKERDAAIADLNRARSCITCNSDSLTHCDGCDFDRTKRKWEWRGVQE